MKEYFSFYNFKELAPYVCDNNCQHNGSSNSCLQQAQKSIPELQKIVDDTTNLVGMQRIEVVSSITANACATYSDWGYPVIAYNPNFMRNVLQFGMRAVETVLCHETGHIWHKHPKNGNVSCSTSHEQELDADYFAGYVMRYRNASLNEILHLMNHPLFLNSSCSHPGSERRRISLRNGWLQADKEINPERYEDSGVDIFFKVAAIGLGAYFAYKGMDALMKD